MPKLISVSPIRPLFLLLVENAASLSNIAGGIFNKKNPLQKSFYGYSFQSDHVTQSECISGFSSHFSIEAGPMQALSLDRIKVSHRSQSPPTLVQIEIWHRDEQPGRFFPCTGGLTSAHSRPPGTTNSTIYIT
jgi:hypothetical protein